MEQRKEEIINRSNDIKRGFNLPYTSEIGPIRICPVARPKNEDAKEI